MNLDFLTGEVLLRAGAPSILAVALLTALAAIRQPRRPLPVGGVLVVGLSFMALTGPVDLGSRLWVGLGLCMIGSAVGSYLWTAVHVALIVPGAALAVSGLGDDVDTWMMILAIVAIAAAGAGADRFGKAHPGSSAPFVMIVGMVGAVFLTVPETDTYAFLLVVATPLLLLTWPKQIVKIGPGGGAGIMSVVAALTLDGGTARSGSIVGGLFAAGLLFLGLSGRTFPEIDRARWAPVAYRLIAAQAMLAFLIVRVAGLREGAVAAGVLTLAFYMVALAVAPRWISEGSLRP